MGPPFARCLSAGHEPINVKPEFRIGCAGWSLSKPVRGQFGEGASVLARYATRFDAVEINSSFYRPHQPETYARWADTVPAKFRFSVKLPRTITHDARIAGVGELLSGFMEEVAALGNKIGPLLVQLPPSLPWEKARAGTFFRMFRRRHSGLIACEPRHASWFTSDATAMLAHHGIARVAATRLPCRGAMRQAERRNGNTGACTARPGSITATTTARRSTISSNG